MADVAIDLILLTLDKPWKSRNFRKVIPYRRLIEGSLAFKTSSKKGVNVRLNGRKVVAIKISAFDFDLTSSSNFG